MKKMMLKTFKILSFLFLLILIGINGCNPGDSNTNETDAHQEGPFSGLGQPRNGFDQEIGCYDGCDSGPNLVHQCPGLGCSRPLPHSVGHQAQDEGKDHVFPTNTHQSSSRG